jgi:hydroxypyruvate isomerase
LSPEELVRAAKRIGYQACELVPEEHWGLVRDAGLTIAAVAGHQSLTDGLNRVENHARIEDEIRANIAKAVEWGIPNLICFSGNRAGLDDATGAEHTAAGLQSVAAAAEEAGIMLVVELLNSKVDHHDYQCDHTAWGAEVCRMVGSPYVKLLYDIYHMQIMEGDVIRTITDNAALIGHYHTAGVPGRRDMDETQELYYPAIMRAIAQSGYEGFVGHEFIPKGDPVVALQSAYDLCNV